MHRRLVLVALHMVGIVRAGWSGERCSTKFGPSSVKSVQTSTRTQTLSVTAYVKVCAKRTKTITPDAVTSTLTGLTTSTITETAPQLTNTIATTSTETTTSTEIFSTTVVQTLTTTITVVSSEIITIPTPTGFTPVASDVTYVPKRRGIRAALSLLQRAKTPEVETIKIDRGGKTHAFSPPVYPQAVKCVKRDRSTTAKTITMPFCTKTKSTTLPPSTATAYDTLTNLVTQTVDQNAATLISTEFTTVTEVTSFTSTQVNITTITETQTSLVPAATVYEACTSNNVVGSANGGHGIYQAQWSGTTTSVSAFTAEECCVACQQTMGCANSVYLFTICYLIGEPTCSSGSTQYFTNSNSKPIRDSLLAMVYVAVGLMEAVCHEAECSWY